jgi:phosphoserine phosphatase
VPRKIELDEIIAEIRAHLDEGGAPYAAFDADGTLWDTDIGETAFERARPLVEDETLLGPVQEFAQRWGLDLSGDDPDAVWKKLAAYALGPGLGDGTAQVSDEHLVDLYALESWIFAGRTEDELVDFGESLFDAKEGAGLEDAIFDDVKRLLAALDDMGVEAVILSGSLRGVLLPGTRRLGIPDARVFGTEPHRDEAGRYLPVAVTMFGPEKGVRLDEVSGARQVAAAFGDAPSGNDKDILHRARLPVAMNPQGRHRDYAREQGMRAWWLK